MNLKELIKKCESVAKDEHINGLQREFHELMLNNLKELDEVAKVEIPQCAIDILKKAKEQGHTLLRAMNLNYKTEEFYKNKEFRDWLKKPENQELFARAWIEGYKLKEEKRYQVRLKGLDKDLEYLNFKHGHVWVFSDNIENEEYRTKHTRKELEEAGFGEVFNSPLFEVEEVK